MTPREAKALLIKYSRPYRNSAEGFLVSAAIFELVTPADSGVLFDAVLEHAERLIGVPVDVAPAPKGWLRIVPKVDMTELVVLQ